MSTENEWFARHEVELLRQARRERDRKSREATAKEAETLRAAHWMKCPKCGHDLVEESVGTVLLDRCGSCGGIFLDRGELEQLLTEDRASQRGFFRRILGFQD